MDAVSTEDLKGSAVSTEDLQCELDDHREKTNAAQEELTKARSELEMLRKENNILKKNISSLYKTTKKVLEDIGNDIKDRQRRRFELLNAKPH